MVIYAPVKMKKDSGQKFQEVDDPNAYDNMIGLFEEGTWNSEIVTELAPHKDDIILVGRNNYSAFQGTDLKQVLERNGVQRLFITGLLTDVCVANTAQDADEFLDGKTQVYVLKDGCCAETQQRHNDTLQFALPMFADIISCQKGLEEIRRNRSTKVIYDISIICIDESDHSLICMSLSPEVIKKN
jgi:nicotinamidase-related amidase